MLFEDKEDVVRGLICRNYNILPGIVDRVSATAGSVNVDVVFVLCDLLSFPI
jgi:hypothetical protein